MMMMGGSDKNGGGYQGESLPDGEKYFGFYNVRALLPINNVIGFKYMLCEFSSTGPVSL